MPVYLRLDPDASADCGVGGLGWPVRVFGLDGKPYPRVAVSLAPNYMGRDGVSVGVNAKTAPKDHWVECNLPDELVPELVSMLAEYLFDVGRPITPESSR